MSDRWVYATTFFMASAIGVVFVFLADLQDRYNLLNWQFGVVAAAGFVAALITQLLLSPLVDRGVVKPLVYLSIIVGGAGTMGFAVAERFWTLAFSRGLVGVGLGLFGITARKAILGLDIAGGGKKVGTLMSTGVGGFIAGPGLGALFGKISFEAPFIVIGIAVLVTGVPAARFVSTAPIRTAPVTYADLGLLVRSPRVQAALLVQLVVFGFIGVFDSILDRYLTDMGASTNAVALALVVMGAPMLFLPRMAGDLAERLGGARVVLPGLALVLPAILLYGFAGGAATVALIGIFHGAGESFSTVSAQVMILEETGTERAAIGNAMMEATGMACATVTALSAPVVYGRWGERVLFGGSFVIAVVVALFILQRVYVVRAADPIRQLEPAGV